MKELSDFVWKKLLFWSSLHRYFLFIMLKILFHHLWHFSWVCLGLFNQHSFVGNMSHLLIGFFFFFLVSWKVFPLSLISWNIISLCLGVRSIFIILHETYCSSTWEMTFNITFSLWIVPLLSFILSSGIHIYIKLFILFSLMHAKKKTFYFYVSFRFMTKWEKGT